MSNIPAQRAAGQPLRVFVYTRISSDTEGRELGVTRQLEDCTAYAKRHGWTVVREYRDNDRGASTRSRKPRPAYAAMLEAVKAGEADVIVAYSASRITRRMADWLELIKLVERTGVRIETVVSGKVDINTADGRMMLQIMASIDQGEAERTAERIARAHRQRVESGRPSWTRRPFGHNRDGSVHATEGAAVKAAAEAIIGGAYLADIVRQWSADGIVTTTGRRFTTVTLGQMLRSPRLAGLLTAGGEIVGPSHHIQPVISEPTWRATVAVLDNANGTDRRRGYQGGGRAERGLLSSLLRCAVCDGPCYIWQAPRRRGPKVRSYQCRDGHVTISADVAEETVTAWLAWMAAENDIDLLPGDGTDDIAPLVERERGLIAAMADTRAELRTATGSFRAELVGVLRDIARDLDQVRAELATAQRAARQPMDVARVLADWDGLTLGERRAIIERGTETIRLYRDGTQPDSLADGVNGPALTGFGHDRIEVVISREWLAAASPVPLSTDAGTGEGRLLLAA